MSSRLTRKHKSMNGPNLSPSSPQKGSASEPQSNPEPPIRTVSGPAPDNAPSPSTGGAKRVDRSQRPLSQPLPNPPASKKALSPANDARPHVGFIGRIRGRFGHSKSSSESHDPSLPAQKAGARKHQSATALSDAVIDKPADRDASTRETRQAERSQNQISQTSPDLLSSQKPPTLELPGDMSPPQKASTIERQPAPVPRVTTVDKPTNTDASTRETGQVDLPRDQISPPSPDPLILQTLQASNLLSDTSTPPPRGNAGTSEHQPPPVLPVTAVDKSVYRDTSTREIEQVDRPQHQISQPSPDPLSSPPTAKLSHLTSPSPPLDKVSANEQRPAPVQPVFIAVMGATGSGKTSFINLASGSSLRVGMGLESSTTEVKRADKFTLDGKPVILIDTPGFDDTTKSDADILKLIAAFLATTYETGSKLTGVIYVHRISDKRFTGTAARNFRMFREFCGDEASGNVVLVTNMWGEVTPEDGQDRENQLANKFFKPVLDLGAQMVRHYNTAKSAHDVVRKLMGKEPVALQIQRELVDEHKDIVDTAAGGALNQELIEQMKRHQDELKGVEEEIEQALKERDEETKRELEEERVRLQEQMEKMKKASEGMASNYAVEKERMEAKMKELEQEAKKQGEQETKKREQEVEVKKVEQEAKEGEREVKNSEQEVKNSEQEVKNSEQEVKKVEQESKSKEEQESKPRKEEQESKPRKEEQGSKPRKEEQGSKPRKEEQESKLKEKEAMPKKEVKEVKSKKEKEVKEVKSKKEVKEAKKKAAKEAKEAKKREEERKIKEKEDKKLREKEEVKQRERDARKREEDAKKREEQKKREKEEEKKREKEAKKREKEARKKGGKEVKK